MVLLTILLIAIMLIISALLAATETAITATSPGKIYKLRSRGNKRAVIALQILKVKEKVISTMLIGNSLINTVCTTIATSLFIDIIEDHSVATILSSAVMAFLIIVFAEVIPKAIAVTKAEEIVLFNARVVVVFLKLLAPVNKMLDLALKIFCFVFRINLTQEISGADEVRGIIEHQHQEGNVYKTDRDMLEGILDIRDMTVSEIMVHRSKMITLNIDLPNSEIIQTALSSPNTRIPIWKESADNIIGVLHIRDLLRALYDNGNDHAKINISKLLSQPWFIPDNALVIQQLHAFKERKNHLACVVDEYGDLQGIITLEDILEEIVGQIHDEYDRSGEAIIKKSDVEYIIDGATTIRDLNRELNWELPDDDANTIAGLIIHKIARIPNQGESIEISNLKIVVVKKIANRIHTVKIKILAPHDNNGD